jgi:hypothetical protein
MIVLAGAISYIGAVWYLERDALIKILSIAGIATPKAFEQHG